MNGAATDVVRVLCLRRHASRRDHLGNVFSVVGRIRMIRMSVKRTTRQIFHALLESSTLKPLVSASSQAAVDNPKMPRLRAGCDLKDAVIPSVRVRYRYPFIFWRPSESRSSISFICFCLVFCRT